jgi:lipopolysaccharide heptosyltransferase II
MNGWDRARNLLCIRLDAMGDVLMTTPAIRALKESHPERRITLLTSPPGAAVARLVPEIDDVRIYESPWMKSTPPKSDARQDRAVIERLRSERFDAAVIFTVFSQSPLPAALVCYLSDIPLRAAHCRENPYQLLTDRVEETDTSARMRHEVRRHLDLAATLGASTADERLSLRVPAGARQAVDSLLGALGIGQDDPWVVIHPGSTAPSRRYPPERYAEAARALVGDLGMRVIFTGSEPEHDLIESIRAAIGGRSESLAGRLDLAELAALIERAPLLIANNTGPVHIAAAVGTPVVDLYAGTNPQHTPWMVPSRVLSHAVPCAPCFKSVCPEGHHDCLRRVSPVDVIDALRDLIAVPASP